MAAFSRALSSAGTRTSMMGHTRVRLAELIAIHALVCRTFALILQLTPLLRQFAH
jgi:hypothetical protein